MDTIEHLVDRVAAEAHELGKLRKKMELAPREDLLRAILAAGDRFEAARVEPVSLIG